MQYLIKKQLFRHSSRQAGFTLIEITIVIFIITMGLIGVLSLATQSIKVSNFNKNEFIASQLAQEGLELVRNERDDNWLVGGGRSWNNDISGGGGGGSSMIFRTDVDRNGSLVPSIDSLLARLIISEGKYVHEGGGTQTPFYRIITTNDWGYYLNVECWVRWRDSGGVHDYKVNTVLYDWK